MYHPPQIGAFLYSINLCQINLPVSYSIYKRLVVGDEKYAEIMFFGKVFQKVADLGLGYGIKHGCDFICY